MNNIEFKTPKEVAEQYHISEITQWRYRKSGELGYYRLAGKLFYSSEQLHQFFESRRYGGERSRMQSVAA